MPTPACTNGFIKGILCCEGVFFQERALFNYDIVKRLEINPVLLESSRSLLSRVGSKKFDFFVCT